MSDRPRVFIDSETTGRGPDRRPWEIAVLYEDSVFSSGQVYVVLDVDLSQAEPEALAMNGIHDRHPIFTGQQPSNDLSVSYLSEADVSMTLHRVLQGVEWVGAQPQFDTECVAAMLRRHGLEPSWHYRLRDIESMTEGFLRRSVGGLQDCARALGVPVDQTTVHSALGDARLVQQCHEAIFPKEV